MSISNQSDPHDQELLSSKMTVQILQVWIIEKKAETMDKVLALYEGKDSLSIEREQERRKIIQEALTYIDNLKQQIKEMEGK